MSSPESEHYDSDDGVETINGIGSARGESLRDAGYHTVGDLQEASVQELTGTIPANIARDVKSAVGNGPPQNIPSIAKAKQKAQKTPGAKAKMVKINGEQVAKVLRKTEEKHLAGATIEVHKG